MFKAIQCTIALIFAFSAASIAKADDCAQTLSKAKDAYQAISLSDSCRNLVNQPGVPSKASVIWNCGLSTGEALKAARDIKDSACNQAACKSACPDSCANNGLAAFLGNVNGGSCR